MQNCPPELIHTYSLLRPGVWPAANNTSASGLRSIGVYVGLMTPKSMIIQDNAGGPVTTADIEIYFSPGIGFRSNDQLLDQGDGTRWRIVKWFPWPTKTIVWAARSDG